MYKEYFKYIKEHKKNVVRACDYWLIEWSDLNSRGIEGYDVRELEKILNRIKVTHDLSKFLPCEFIPYAKKFYGKYVEVLKKDIVDKDELKEYESIDRAFDIAWEHHQLKNKHHWNYWTYDIDAYYTQMCDLYSCKLDVPNIMPKRYIIEMICDWTAMSMKFGDTPQEYYLRNYTSIELNRVSRYMLEVYLGLLYYNAPICECNEEYYMTIGELKVSGVNLNHLLRPSCLKYDLNYDVYDI